MVILKDVDKYLERRKSRAVSPELIEPTREVVKIAMERVKEGSIDDIGRQSIVLENETAGKIFQIMLIGARRQKREFELVGGLFVGGFQLDESGVPKWQLTGIQIPQVPEKVTKDNIFTLRGIDAASMKQLSVELATARPVGTGKYERVLNTWMQAGEKYTR